MKETKENNYLHPWNESFIVYSERNILKHAKSKKTLQLFDLVVLMYNSQYWE